MDSPLLAPASMRMRAAQIAQGSSYEIFAKLPDVSTVPVDVSRILYRDDFSIVHKLLQPKEQMNPTTAPVAARIKAVTARTLHLRQSRAWPRTWMNARRVQVKWTATTIQQPTVCSSQESALLPMLRSVHRCLQTGQVATTMIPSSAPRRLATS